MHTYVNPKNQGYTFPAEWFPRQSTWMSFPHNQETWPDKYLKQAQSEYLDLIKVLSEGEKINLLINSDLDDSWIARQLEERSANLGQVIFHRYDTDDAWCRDYGPAFVINPKSAQKMIVNWSFNAWGGKYPYEKDDAVAEWVANKLGLAQYTSDLKVEGGGVELNGKGTLLSTRSCLLNPNRNPNYGQSQVEEILCNAYGVEQIIWLDGGLAGGDTDGHIDEITRFVDDYTLLSTLTHDTSDVHYEMLQSNWNVLSQAKSFDGHSFELIELPLPSPVVHEGQRMPASYANFYIANAAVIVPIFEVAEDAKALEIIQSCFPNRKVIGLDSRAIIWGLGSFHCLTQQEPLIKGES